MGQCRRLSTAVTDERVTNSAPIDPALIFGGRFVEPLRLLGLPRRELSLLTAICAQCNFSGDFRDWMDRSIEFWMRATGYCRRSVQDSIRELERRGILVRGRKPGDRGEFQFKRSLYRLTAKLWRLVAEAVAAERVAKAAARNGLKVVGRKNCTQSLGAPEPDEREAKPPCLDAGLDRKERSVQLETIRALEARWRRDAWVKGNQRIAEKLGSISPESVLGRRIVERWRRILRLPEDSEFVAAAPS